MLMLPVPVLMVASGMAPLLTVKKTPKQLVVPPGKPLPMMDTLPPVLAGPAVVVVMPMLFTSTPAVLPPPIVPTAGIVVGSEPPPMVTSPPRVVMLELLWNTTAPPLTPSLSEFITTLSLLFVVRMVPEMPVPLFIRPMLCFPLRVSVALLPAFLVMVPLI